MFRNIFKNKLGSKSGSKNSKSKIRAFVKEERSKLNKKYGDPKEHREKEYALFVEKFTELGNALTYKPKKKPESVPRFLQKFDQRMPEGMVTIFSEKLANINKRNIYDKEKKQMYSHLYNQIVAFEK